MIRIAHISDSHFDERGRLDDVVAIHHEFLRQARAAEVELIVHGGDWFERRSTPTERIAVANFLQEAAGFCPVFGVKGNHDAAQDLEVFNRLDTAFPVRILDRPTTPAHPAEIMHLALGGGRVGLIALPWFDKAHLVATLDAEVDAEQSRQMTITAARDLLTCLRAEADRVRKAGAAPILVSHTLVQGSETSSGQVLIGTTVELAPADLAEGFAYAALGHIHKAQDWYGGRVAYSGSPHRCNFGEPEAKGWRLVTIDDAGEFVSSEFRELPARRMVFLEVDWTKTKNLAIEPNTFALGQRDEVDGALIRFRYHVRAEDLRLVDESVIEKVFLADGAHDVKLEAIVETDTRVRSEEITTVQTTAEKVEAFWRAKSIDVDEPTRERVFSNLAEMEAR